MRGKQGVRDMPIVDAYIRHYTSTYDTPTYSPDPMRTNVIKFFEVDESLSLLASSLLKELHTFWTTFHVQFKK